VIATPSWLRPGYPSGQVETGTRGAGRSVAGRSRELSAPWRDGWRRSNCRCESSRRFSGRSGGSASHIGRSPAASGKYGQRRLHVRKHGGYPIDNALHVDVDRAIPIVDLQRSSGECGMSREFLSITSMRPYVSTAASTRHLTSWRRVTSVTSKTVEPCMQLTHRRQAPHTRGAPTFHSRCGRAERDSPAAKAASDLCAPREPFRLLSICSGPRPIRRRFFA